MIGVSKKNQNIVIQNKRNKNQTINIKIILQMTFKYIKTVLKIFILKIIIILMKMVVNKFKKMMKIIIKIFNKGHRINNIFMIIKYIN